MADLAAEPLAILPDLQHALLELTFVRVRMAALTGQILPVIWNFRFGLRGLCHLVAISAGSREMSSRQIKSNLFVARERESRWNKTIHVMTLLATI